MDSAGQELGTAFQFPNNRPGAEAFVKSVSEQVQAGDYDTVRLATEATGWYWFSLVSTAVSRAAVERSATGTVRPQPASDRQIQTDLWRSG